MNNEGNLDDIFNDSKNDAENAQDAIEDDVNSCDDKASASDNSPALENDEKASNNADNQELTGRILDSSTYGVPNSATPKEPLFKLEIRKPGCNRDDNILLLSKKIGFFGLITFLLLSIVFGMVMKYWHNFLNLLFMGLAIASYGVQCAIHLFAISKCNCQECVEQKKKLKLFISLCALGVILFIVLTVLRAMAII